MSISDLIKNKFVEEFTAISVGTLLTTLLLSFVLGLFVLVIYRVTFGGVSFSKSFALSLVMLSMVTSLAILTVRSNVVLSLGMVGALSISDTTIMASAGAQCLHLDHVSTQLPYAVTVAIVSFVGFIVAGFVQNVFVTWAVGIVLLLGALFLALNLLSGKLHTNSYLVVMRYTPEGESAVRSKLGTLGKYKLKSRTMNLAETELVVEAKLSQKQMDSLEALLDNEGVSDVNIVSYNGSTLL